MRSLATFISLFFVWPTFSQIEVPLVSPPAQLKQTIGFTEIIVDYSRPSARGRKVMGQLVPNGRIWRVGANESTKISFGDDVKLEGHFVPAGTYALYAFPEEKQWTIVIHKNTSHWGDGRDEYDPKDDLVRFVVAPSRTKSYQETFTIDFDELSHESAKMTWTWEQTRISFLVEVDTDSKMMRQIENAIANNPTADTYYQSARYLQEKNKMHQQALEWIAKAHQLAGDKYYIHRVWALVLAQSGDYANAISHAEKSKQLAALEGKDEFVRMNELSVTEWQKKKR
ncbi:MAG: DUF2911 domain-containing protein [Cyclobacteriaceae bacterium]